jgi:uncharacterized protein YndB with AHSA1/START domain
MRVERSVDIAASPEKTWPFLVEPERILKWVTTFKKFEYTSEQRSGVGTPIYVEEKAGPTPLMKLNFTVTEWVENVRLAYSMTSGSGVKRYEISENIEPTLAGSKFTFMENVELPWGIVGKLLGSIGQRTAEGHIQKYLAKLKSLVES